MFSFLIRRVAAVAMFVSASAIAQSPAYTEPIATGPVMVVVEVALAVNATPPDALVALNDIRALMKKQPEFLQNLNASNVLRHVHVFRWASMTYWAALIGTPEFNKLSAHGNEHFTIAVKAFRNDDEVSSLRSSASAK